MAFYTQGRIDRVVRAILQIVPVVVLDRRVIAVTRGLSAGTKANLCRLLEKLVRDGDERVGREQQVVFLSEPDVTETIRLAHDVRHDQRGAFTQGRRYVSVTTLRKSPHVTSELIATGA